MHSKSHTRPEEGEHNKHAAPVAFSLPPLAPAHGAAAVLLEPRRQARRVEHVPARHDLDLVAHDQLVPAHRALAPLPERPEPVRRHLLHLQCRHRPLAEM